MICPNDKNVADFLAAPVDKNNQRHEENSIYQKISINPRFKLNLKIPVQANIIFAKNKFSLISSPITENVFHPLPFLYSCRTKHLDQILSPPPSSLFLELPDDRQPDSWNKRASHSPSGGGRLYSCLLQPFPATALPISP